MAEPISTGIAVGTKLLDPKLWKGLVGFCLAALFTFFALIALIASLFPSIGGGSGGIGRGIGSMGGMPVKARPFVGIYNDAAKVFGVNAFLLMAVHEDETDYGTAPLPGVQNGVNTAGCCAGPMQFLIEGGAAVGGRGGTWAGYADAYTSTTMRRPDRYPGKHAPHPNVYDSFDSIYAAAKYFQALNAGPQLDKRTFEALKSYKGTPPASIPFARADYERAKELELIALAHADVAPVDPRFGTAIVNVPATAPWLGGVPGFPDERCDKRILPNLMYLVATYKLHVGDCYSTQPPHTPNGEHPLGLGVDLTPGPEGSWDLVDQLARWAEPTQRHPIPPFRWVGYDGDVNHGRGHHLHLSWAHSPAGFNQQASTVTVAR